MRRSQKLYSNGNSGAASKCARDTYFRPNYDRGIAYLAMEHHLAIVDFGGAKAIGEESGLTSIGQVVGTPNYMSPEQILGQPLDARSDLNSLGVILHQLLTGRTLYQADDTAELMDLHVNAPLPQLPAHLAGFQKLLSRLVAEDPDRRFASARDLYAHIAA